MKSRYMLSICAILLFVGAAASTAPAPTGAPAKCNDGNEPVTGVEPVSGYCNFDNDDIIARPNGQSTVVTKSNATVTCYVGCTIKDTAKATASTPVTCAKGTPDLAKCVADPTLAAHFIATRNGRDPVAVCNGLTAAERNGACAGTRVRGNVGGTRGGVTEITIGNTSMNVGDIPGRNEAPACCQAIGEAAKEKTKLETQRLITLVKGCFVDSCAKNENLPAPAKGWDLYCNLIGAVPAKSGVMKNCLLACKDALDLCGNKNAGGIRVVAP